MTTKIELVQAIETVDTRVHELTPRLLARGDAELPQSTWHVREALSHLAARANSVPLAMAAAERARAQAPGGSAVSSGVTEIDEVNQKQIDDRRGRTLPELLDEIHAGHKVALKQVRSFDDQTLDERLVVVAGRGEWSFAELLLRAGPGHENNHLDQIEKALGAEDVR